MTEAKLHTLVATSDVVDGPYRSDPRATSDHPLYGYSYTPHACRFFAVDHEGLAKYADGADVRLDQIFEMRVFGQQWELRWLRDGPTARMSIISDGPLDSRFEATPRGPLTVLKRTGQQLLWGKAAAGAPGGWTRLTSQRIGSIEAPFQSKGAARLALTTVEYFRQDQATGNWVFMTSRLSGFAAA